VTERGLTRVLLVDDHPVVRDGVRVAVESGIPPVLVVGECGSGEEALEVVGQLDVDVVVMDIRLPGMSGIEATRALRAAHPRLSVILLTAFESDLFLSEGVRAGAAGFLLKGSPVELISWAIGAAVNGGSLVPTEFLFEAFARLPKEDEQAVVTPGLPSLSSRELEVVVLLTQGYANKAIADRLGLAESTIKKYVQSVVGKLNARDRTHAATLALRLGIVE
jgi:DNA-binding NarL/FixJ family response regulator